MKYIGHRVLVCLAEQKFQDIYIYQSHINRSLRYSGVVQILISVLVQQLVVKL